MLTFALLVVKKHIPEADGKPRYCISEMVLLVEIQFFSDDFSPIVPCMIYQGRRKKACQGTLEYVEIKLGSSEEHWHNKIDRFELTNCTFDSLLFGSMIYGREPITM